MNRYKIKIAKQEAERFLQHVKEMEARWHGDDERGYPVYGHEAQAGALRRSSLDLTRALAAMRRPS